MCRPGSDLAVHHNMHWAAGPAHDGGAWPNAALTLWPDGRAGTIWRRERPRLWPRWPWRWCQVSLLQCTTYTSGNVTWRHLQKALYCDELQQKVWKQNLGMTCTLLQRIIAAGSLAEPVKGPEALQARRFALGSSHARAAEAEHHRHCPATAPQHQGIRDGGRPEGDRTNLKGCRDCQSYTACPWYGTMAAA